MMKKKSNLKWGLTKRKSFEAIKQAIIDAPSLSTLDFTKHFLLYNFSFQQSYAAVLTHPNEQQIEASISFFSSNLQGVELNDS